MKVFSPLGFRAETGFGVKWAQVTQVHTHHRRFIIKVKYHICNVPFDLVIVNVACRPEMCFPSEPHRVTFIFKCNNYSL